MRKGGGLRRVVVVVAGVYGDVIAEYCCRRVFGVG